MARLQTRTLADYGLEAFRLFEDIVQLESRFDTASAQGQTLSSIAAEGDHFKVWAVNLGLLVPGHGSLDYRVREAESLAQTFQSFLDDLNGSLQEGRTSLLT